MLNVLGKFVGFWCVSDEDVHTNEAIEADKPLEELRQEPYSLPAGFCWDSLDIDNPIVVCYCV